jgi:hypothetical protein
MGGIETESAFALLVFQHVGVHCGHFLIQKMVIAMYTKLL